MKTNILILSAVFFVGGCAANKPVPVPEYAGVARKAEEVSGSLGKIREQGESVRSLQLDSMGLLDRLDYKATVLLER